MMPGVAERLRDLGTPAIATTSPAQTLTVRPGLTTRPRAIIRSPRAGDRKFTLYSIVSTDAPGGISVMAT